MRVIVQRSKNSCVYVNNQLINKIDRGLVLLVSFTQDDTEVNIIKMAKKIANLRIFDDEDGIMNKSILEVGGDILSISQFTLYADTKKGNRPSYLRALNNQDAKKLYEQFNKEMNKYVKTLPGVFGADMQLSILNDGPITILLEI